jgi:hypothetical protein
MSMSRRYPTKVVVGGPTRLQNERGVDQTGHVILTDRRRAVERRIDQARVICLAILVVAGVAFWFGVYEPIRRHKDFCSATRAELETLAKKRPPDLTREQWNNIVGWTLNGHGNSVVAKRPGLGGPRIPRAEMDRFLAELRQRLSGPVDLQTINWIWDEFVRLAPESGRHYSERYRPTSPEKLREFKGMVFDGIDVD